MSLSIDKIQNIESVAFILRCKYVTSSCNNITLQICYCCTYVTVLIMSHPYVGISRPPTWELRGATWELIVDPYVGK